MSIMALLGTALGVTSGLGKALGGPLSALFSNRANRRTQDAQNAFNAQQAQLNRDFQSAEAEIARDWQEKFYTQYQSPEAMVRQYEAAGLNPALMYGGAGPSSGSVPSTSTPSGSQATSSQSYFMDSLQIIDSVMRLDMLKAEIERTKKEGYKAEMEGDEAGSRIPVHQAEAVYKDKLSSLTDKQIEEVEEKILKLAQETKSEEIRTSILEVDKELKEYAKADAKWRKDFRESHGMTGDEPLWQMIYKISVKRGQDVWEFLKENLSELAFLNQKSLPLTSSGNPYGL